MRIFRSAQSAGLRALLHRRPEPDPDVERVVRSILEEVRKGGDKALLRLTHKFGGPLLRKKNLAVDEGEIRNARRSLERATRAAIRASKKNVLAFARRSLRKTWFRKNAQGAIVGERFDPFERVGIYIPGGTAPLASSAIMTCALASAAGVPEIVALTPPEASGEVHPALLTALAECGATEIYRVGGAQAIAALAFGTETIRPVHKIFGPGNAYVVEAKRQVFGRVAVDLLPGPSEILVIADGSANPAWIAADLLAQCEHGHGSAGILLSDSASLVDQVAQAIRGQLSLSTRRKALEAALRNVVLAAVPSLKEAVDFTNAWAPEHVSIVTRRPGEIARRLTSSGAIFLGGMSPVAIGDFLAGPSHTLPTGGAGKSFSGLTADQFQRRTSVLIFDKEAVQKSASIVEAFGRVEGLDAHVRSVTARLEK